MPNKLTRTADVLLSTVASTTSLWRGTSTSPAVRRPEKLLALYEFENCPFCRVVREALTVLDIDAMIYPCPKGGDRYRSVMRELGGKEQFPFLVDENTGVKLYESEDIVDYLFSTYAGSSPLLQLHFVKVLTSNLSSMVRAGKGTSVKPSIAPELPLILYSFESSPFSRKVRELLSEMQLPYELRNTGKDTFKDMGPPEMRATLFPNLPVTGRNRIGLLERAGKVQVPYLIDPNTDIEMFESGQIMKYLIKTYGV